MHLASPNSPSAASPLYREDAPLIRAAVRHAQAQSGLDLSRCCTWLRFAELHYSRPAGPHGIQEADEVVVVYLALVAEALPGADEWPGVWAQQQEWKQGKEAHEKVGAV
jgi:hypothetical protein